MLKNIEEINPTKKRLVIEVPKEEIEKEFKGTLEDVRRRTRIPGFRPGKAPMSLIEKKFAKDVESDMLERLIPRHYSDAVKEAGIKPVGSPQFEGKVDFKRDEALTMTLTVDVMPTIGEIKYKGVKVTDIPYNVKDEEIDRTLQRVREDKATFEPTEEPLAMGDLAVIDYEIGVDGSSFKDQVVRLGGRSVPEQFSEGLAGKKKGEDFDITVDFPEDYPSKEIAGQAVQYKVSLKDTKRAVLPEIDDELAKDIGQDSLEALKNHIREQLTSSRASTVKRMQQGELMSNLLEAHAFEVPESLVESEAENLAHEAIAAEKARGDEGGDFAAVKEKMKGVAVRNIKSSFLLETIGEKENVKVTEDEIKGRINEVAAANGVTPEHVMKYYVARDGSLEGLRRAVFEDKVLDLLLESAEVVKAPEEKKEKAPKAEKKETKAKKGEK